MSKPLKQHKTQPCGNKRCIQCISNDGKYESLEGYGEFFCDKVCYFAHLGSDYDPESQTVEIEGYRFTVEYILKKMEVVER